MYLEDGNIYDSDSVLDYFDTITALILREMSYLLSPEQVKPSAVWTRDVVTVMEIMLLFDRNSIGTTSYLLDGEQAVKRWRTTFISIWDAEWEDTKYPLLSFSSATYRQEHRRIIIKWFDRLEEIAASFGEKDLETFAPEESLPYFSSRPGNFLGILMERLLYSIVFTLSDENRDMAIGFFEIDHVWAAVDMLSRLCESYACSPSVTAETVERWRQKTVDIWKARFAEESWEWVEDKLYQSVMSRFDRLRDLAQQYPPGLY
jgi:hypothetical protein